MINYCKKKFRQSLFEISDEPTEICDFTIISGTSYESTLFHLKQYHINSKGIVSKGMCYGLTLPRELFCSPKTKPRKTQTCNFMCLNYFCQMLMCFSNFEALRSPLPQKFCAT